MNIYGYCRISTAKQSIDRQIRNIKAEYPTAHIVQEAYTGTSIFRPEWLKLYRVLKAGDKQQDFLTLTGAARRARSEGYDITYHSLRNLVAAGYISHVPNGSRIYVFYPNVIRFLQKGLTAEQSLDYQLSRARN